jgi:hypothetical protein
MMYFLENYSPIETYNYVHSTIKYKHQSPFSQFVVANDINGSLPIQISQASIHQIDSIPQENLTDSDFLVPKTDLSQNVPEVGKNICIR